MELSQLFSEALALHNNAQPANAILIYQRILCFRPAASGVLGLLGTAKTQEGDHAEALRFLRRALVLDPTRAATHSNLGIAYKGLNCLEKALASQKNSLVLAPAFFDGLRNLALTLQALELSRKALRFTHLAHQLCPERPEALSLMGVILAILRRMDDAILTQKQAISLQPSDAEAYNNLGVALLQTMKTDAALTITERSLIIQPQNPETWLNRGTSRWRLRDHEGARLAFKTAIALNPALAQALMGLGVSLQSDREYRRAAAFLERAYQINSALAGALNQALFCRSKALEWGALKTLLFHIKKELTHCKSIDSPFPLLTRLDNPRLHLLAARSFARKSYPETISDAPQEPQTIQRKIHIGYFSSDLHELHPVFKNLHPLLRHHDRGRFKLFCFDNSAAGEVAARDLFDEVIHIRSMADEEVTMLARQKMIDIAIDLNGYTEDARTEVFAARAAPLQINYLGYPGSMGSSYHDYIIADAHVIPYGQEHFYTETVIRLPSFFMPYDLRANRLVELPQVRRVDYGLPEKGFIYCSFNDFHKITEKTFASWIRILLGAQNSFLWIATRGDIGIDEIKIMARDAGIDPERIIKADRVETPREHHARLALADLMLDTFPYNSHTTACDAISMGLPIISIAGISFASRVSASLLSEVGADFLITTCPTEYEKKAIALASEPQTYKIVKQQIESAIDRIITPELYARNLEDLLEKLLNDPKHSSPC